MLRGIEPRPERMKAALAEGFATATDLADYLVRKGLAFRDAHEAVARAVRAAEQSGRDLSQLSVEELRAFSALVGPDVHGVLTAAGSAASRSHIGGTAPQAVRAAVARARKNLQATRAA
jgi:argininosuccinate lyase